MKKIKMHSKAWDDAMIDLALSRLGPVIRCANCGGPRPEGYMCETCNCGCCGQKCQKTDCKSLAISEIGYRPDGKTR